MTCACRPPRPSRPAGPWRGTRERAPAGSPRPTRGRPRARRARDPGRWRPSSTLFRSRHGPVYRLLGDGTSQDMTRAFLRRIVRRIRSIPTGTRVADDHRPTTRARLWRSSGWKPAAGRRVSDGDSLGETLSRAPTTPNATRSPPSASVWSSRRCRAPPSRCARRSCSTTTRAWARGDRFTGIGHARRKRYSRALGRWLACFKESLR